MNRRPLAFLAVAVLPFALLGCAATPTGIRTAPTASGPAPAPAAKGNPGGFCALFGDGMLLKKYVDLPAEQIDQAQAKRDLRALADAAPAEIRPDLTIVINADLAVINGEKGAIDRFGSPEVSGAMERFSAWFEKHCGPVD
ncbi:hypothetical protein R8Z50_17745 [Longispora sp. K20-0274]|uniref:hypothetical protein n=1 Tax=Longispora sp. K20-0274 TaxID=3088255 RepID=UPI003999CCB4